MTTPLAIKFPLNLFIPEKFGLTKTEAVSDLGRLAEKVAGLLGEIFKKIGQNARIA